MKKIFTLIAGLVLTIAAMAADRYPDLTVRNSRNFKIVIDGRPVYSNNSFVRINHLSRGMHTISVLEVRNSFFGQRERVVNSSRFWMANQDMRINIDYAGRIDVLRDSRRDDRNDGWGFNDRSNDRSYDQRDQTYGQRDQTYGQKDQTYGQKDQPYDQRNDDRRSDNNRNDLPRRN